MIETLSSSGAALKIAAYNVNGINGRLEILLRWLKEDKPDGPPGIGLTGLELDR